jgi:APA family basic amino acid/polyamine antiporter
MVFVSLFAAFVPVTVVGEMTSIGTLFAFILVSFGIIVMRRTHPNVPRAFKTPLVPLVPALGIATCFYMMYSLPFDTWLRLIIWMAIGFVLYFAYGAKHSKLRKAAMG